MNGDRPAAPRAPVRRAISPGARLSYSISEAAALLGVSRQSIWRWVRDGRLPVSRLGHRTVRVAHDDLERLLLQTGRARGAAPDRWSFAPGGDADRSLTPPAGWRTLDGSGHTVQFYETDAFLVDSVAAFIGAALAAGEAGIVVATAAHRLALEERFHTAGLDLTAARAEGRYLALDAAATLAQIVIDGAPDPGRFKDVIGGIVARAAETGRRVRIFGEMVALLADVGDHPAAVRLEELWNDLQTQQTFFLVCAYPIDRFTGEALAGVLDDVCAAHSRVVPAESYTALSAADDRPRAIAVLQQKARSLEAEIAERERTEGRLRAALAEARDAHAASEAALRLRDAFLSAAAHELRTPLTALSGQAQLVLRQLERIGRLDPEQAARSLHAITRQVERLSRLLGQLLDISRLEAGVLTLEQEPTDLIALVEQTVSDARLVSEHHPIIVTAPERLEATVDPLRLEQVLTTLLDNAIRYSPDGGPIEVSLAQNDDAAVECTIRDHGQGVAPELRARFFERFSQAHAERYWSGLGLGLSLCREIVDLHGGAISAESPEDGGTRIRISLPCC